MKIIALSHSRSAEVINCVFQFVFNSRANFSLNWKKKIWNLFSIVLAMREPARATFETVPRFLFFAAILSELKNGIITFTRVRALVGLCKCGTSWRRNHFRQLGVCHSIILNLFNYFCHPTDDNNCRRLAHMRRRAERTAMNSKLTSAANNYYYFHFSFFFFSVRFRCACSLPLFRRCWNTRDSNTNSTRSNDIFQSFCFAANS